MTTAVRWNPGGAYWAAVLLGLPAAAGASLWAISTVVPLGGDGTVPAIAIFAPLAAAAARLSRHERSSSLPSPTLRSTHAPAQDAATPGAPAPTPSPARARAAPPR